ncbi:MAG: hypothetical protein ACFE0Q_11260 [Anaerolineae bacterium]
MTTRYRTNQSAVAVSRWWEDTQQRLQLFLDMMRDGGLIADKEINNALTYLTARIAEMTTYPYPPVASNIHAQLLECLHNIKQSLLYRRANNPYQAQTRLDLARVNMDTVRYHLLKFDILA